MYYNAFPSDRFSPARIFFYTQTDHESNQIPATGVASACAVETLCRTESRTQAVPIADIDL